MKTLIRLMMSGGLPLLGLALIIKYPDSTMLGLTWGCIASCFMVWGIDYLERKD